MPHRHFTVLLLVFVFLRLIFVVATPLWPAGEHARIPGFNDEAAHYNYIVYLAEHRSFPVQTMSAQDSLAFQLNTFEYYQPPLYYIAGVPLYFAGKKLLGAHAHILVRLLSLVCGILTLVVIYRICLLTFKDKPALAQLGFIFGGLLGAHVRASSLVGNDSLAWLVASLLFFFLLHRIQEGGFKGEFFIFTFLLSLGMLTKSSLLVLYPLLFIPFLYGRELKNIFLRLVFPVMIMIVSLVVISPWYIRNYFIYHQLLALSVGSGTPAVPITAFDLKSITTFLFYSCYTFFFPFFTFWFTAGTKITVALLGVATIIMAGVALIKNKYQPWSGWKRDPQQCVLIGGLLLATAGYIFFFISYHQAEARHLFIALPVIIIFFSAVLGRLVKRTGLAMALIAAINGIIYTIALLS